ELELHVLTARRRRLLEEIDERAAPALGRRGQVAREVATDRQDGLEPGERFLERRRERVAALDGQGEARSPARGEVLGADGRRAREDEASRGLEAAPRRAALDGDHVREQEERRHGREVDEVARVGDSSRERFLVLAGPYVGEPREERVAERGELLARL